MSWSTRASSSCRALAERSGSPQWSASSMSASSSSMRRLYSMRAWSSRMGSPDARSWWIPAASVASLPRRLARRRLRRRGPGRGARGSVRRAGGPGRALLWCRAALRRGRRRRPSSTRRRGAGRWPARWRGGVLRPGVTPWLRTGSTSRSADTASSSTVRVFAEADARAGDEVAHGARHQDLPGCSLLGDLWRCRRQSRRRRRGGPRIRRCGSRRVRRDLAAQRRPRCRARSGCTRRPVESGEHAVA